MKKFFLFAFLLVATSATVFAQNNPQSPKTGQQSSPDVSGSGSTPKKVYNSPRETHGSGNIDVSKQPNTVPTRKRQ